MVRVIIANMFEIINEKNSNRNISGSAIESSLILFSLLLSRTQEKRWKKIKSIFNSIFFIFIQLIREEEHINLSQLLLSKSIETFINPFKHSRKKLKQSIAQLLCFLSEFKEFYCFKF